MDRGLLVQNLEGFRHTLVRLLIIAFALGAASYYYNQQLIVILKRPLGQELAYYKVTEAFYATLKVSLYASVFLVMPLIFLALWRFCAPLFFLRASGQVRGERSRTGLVVFFASFLFYGGAALCYFIVLPSGVKILTTYGQGQMEPLLSADLYITFVMAFLFAFGMTFQLPLVAVLLSRAGIINHRMLTKYRRYAILGIVVIAAVVTPTPDIYNLSLMAVPLLALYEISIILVRFFGKKKAPVS